MALEKIISPATELAGRITHDLGGSVVTEVHNITVNIYARPTDREVADAVRRELRKGGVR